MKRTVALAVGAVIVAAAVALVVAQARDRRAGQTADRAAYRNVSPEELRAMLRRKDFLLVNVHIPYAGAIEETDVFVPYTEVEARAPVVLPDRQAKVVVYCQTGRMSAIAADALVRMGYTDVVNLDGGMVAWDRAGYPLRRR